MMTILDKANEYIGHPREVDEGYEVSMRRTAFEEGFKSCLSITKTFLEKYHRYLDLCQNLENYQELKALREEVNALENELNNYITEL